VSGRVWPQRERARAGPVTTPAELAPHQSGICSDLMSRTCDLDSIRRYCDAIELTTSSRPGLSFRLRSRCARTCGATDPSRCEPQAPLDHGLPSAHRVVYFFNQYLGALADQRRARDEPVERSASLFGA
jgi:hypothetical protein